MNSIKWLIVFHFIAQITFIVCITFASIHFGKPGILWWYLVPAFTMGMEVKDYKDTKKDD